MPAQQQAVAVGRNHLKMPRITLIIISTLAFLQSVIGQDSIILRTSRFQSLTDQLSQTNIAARFLLTELKRSERINPKDYQQISNSIISLSRWLRQTDNPDPKTIKILSSKYHIVQENLLKYIDSLHLTAILSPPRLKKAVVHFIDTDNIFQARYSEYDDLNWAHRELLFGRYLDQTKEPL